MTRVTRSLPWLSGLLAVLVFTAYDWGSKAFPWPRWTLLPVLVLALLAWAWPQIKSRFEPDAPDALVSLLVVWAWLSIAWSPDQAYTLLCAVRLSMMAALWYVARRLDLTVWLPCVCGIAVAVVVYQLASNDPYVAGFGNTNHLAEFLLLSLPFLAFGVSEKAVKPLTGVGLMIPLMLLAWVAFAYAFFLGTSNLPYVVGVGVFAIWLVNRFGKHAIAPMLILAVFVALWLADNPATYLHYIARHLHQRLQVYLSTLAMIWDHPLLGVGLGMWDREYPDYQSVDQYLWPSIHSTVWDSPYMRPGNAHNDFLHLTAELGLIGFGLFMAAMLVMWKRSTSEVARMAVVIGLILSLLDFPMQKFSPGPLCVLILACMGRRA